MPRKFPWRRTGGSARFIPALVALCVGALPMACVADGAVPDASAVVSIPTVTPKTLADALKAAPISKDRTVIAVGADAVMLPPGGLAPDTGATAGQVAASYGMMAQEYHQVTAVAAPTMTVLTADPGAPNPYAGLPGGDVLKLLLATLSPAQWKIFTGPSGIGADDLPDRSQLDLFNALFPGDHFQAFPLGAAPNSSVPWHPIDISPEDLRHARLRLTQATSLALSLAGRHSEYLSSNATPPGIPYQISSPSVTDQDRSVVGGVRLRSVVSNHERSGDLDWDRIDAAKTVSVEGVRTVKDLVARIGEATGLELYADHRYEVRSIACAGATDASAQDLLRALSLCLSATYRKVGPAYVLTPDLAGVGAHRTALYRFAATLAMSRAGALAEAGDRLITAHGLANIPDISGVGMTDAQRAKAAAQGNMPGGTMTVTLPFNQLTADQQEQARKMASESYENGATRLSLDGDVIVSTQPMLLLTVPSVPGPLQADPAFPTAGLFTPSSRLTNHAAPEPQASDPSSKETAAEMAAGLKNALSALPRRAVRARPATVAEVDSVIESMRALGMNALFLDVFSRGTAHTLVRHDSGAPDQTASSVAGSPRLRAAAMTEDTEAQPGGLLRTDATADILGEAVAKASSAGIAVFPVVDLLAWGDDAPKEARDLTILGETSDQAASWRLVYTSVLWHGKTVAEAQAAAPHEATWVSPDSDAVRNGLLPFLHDIAQTPGVAGMVLRDTAAPGYEHTDPGSTSWTYSELGFTPSLRLALLRSEHTDPLDLRPEANDGGIEMDLSIPEFDSDELMNPVQSAWNTVRGKADADLMTAVYREVAGRRRELWVEQRLAHARGNWFGLWPAEDAPLPMLSEELQYNPDTSIEIAAFAHTQSPLALGIVHADPDMGDAALTAKLKALRPGWDGVLLDFGRESGDPLKAFAKRQRADTSPKN